MKLKFLLVSVLSIFVFNDAFSQSFRDRTFHSIGITYYADLYRTPIKATISGGNVTYADAFGFSYGTFIYRFRVNLLEAGDDAALSLSLSPAVGVGYTDGTGDGSTGIGIFNLPLWLNGEFGAGSTYNTSSNFGGAIGAGFEMVKAPMFFVSKGDGEPLINTFWMQPSFYGSFRFWVGGNRLMELAFKGGFTGKKYYTEFINGPIESRRGFTGRFAFIYFINY